MGGGAPDPVITTVTKLWGGWSPRSPPPHSYTYDMAHVLKCMHNNSTLGSLIPTHPPSLPPSYPPSLAPSPLPSPIHLVACCRNWSRLLVDGVPTDNHRCRNQLCLCKFPDTHHCWTHIRSHLQKSRTDFILQACIHHFEKGGSTSVEHTKCNAWPVYGEKICPPPSLSLKPKIFIMNHTFTITFTLTANFISTITSSATLLHFTQLSVADPEGFPQFPLKPPLN